MGRCACGARLRPHIVFFGEIPLEMGRIQREIARATLILVVGTSGSLRYISAVEIDAIQEIWRKVESDRISSTCPRDQCVDEVLEEVRYRYLGVLAKIDRREKLEKDEGALFQLLTGSKANRWTWVYRRECEKSRLQGFG